MVWRGRTRLRAAVAIAAAYAVALQMLFGGLLTAQAQANGVNPFVICYGLDAGNADGGDHAPAKINHDLCALVCAQAMGAVADLPTFVAVPFVLRTSAPVYAALRTNFALASPFSPKLSQGPPQIA